ncbi:MAG: SufS family cysteine desulfurase [Muribaculaceae bacterium]|nr:SufS family cysteine desulfurase [Muribaculaceae bacterium]
MDNESLVNGLCREDFPILSRSVNSRPLVYLDNTATSQTPRCVVDTVVESYYGHKANVHRGVHTLSQEATELQEQARRRVQTWLNASSSDEIIFVRGTTEALNLVAASFGPLALSKDKCLVLTVMEHHANIVPWQLLQARLGFDIEVVGMLPDGSLDMGRLRSILSERPVGIVSVCHASNVLGTVNPVKDIAAMAHSAGAYVVVDGAQAVPHLSVDVADLDVDFYAFSAHKMYGPQGVGVLYGRRSLLAQMPPYQGGGEMIASVSFEHTEFAELPFKFEAGTPDFVGIAAMTTAIDYIESVGLQRIEEHEKALYDHVIHRLDSEVQGIDIYGTAPGKCAILSFNLRGAHHYDVGVLLDKLGVAVRTGHHCAQPLMRALGIEGCVRASFALYNTLGEADAFVDALKRVQAMLVRN